MSLENIMRQHSNSVAAVFKARGVNLPVTPGNVILQTILHKDDFINQVADQVEKDNKYTGFTGPAISIDPFTGLPLNLGQSIADYKAAHGGGFNATKTLPTAVISTPKTKSNKVKNTLQDILTTVAGTFGTFLGAKQAAKANNTTAAAGTTSGTKATPEEEKKKSKTFLIGAIILIAILLIAVFAASQNKGR